MWINEDLTVLQFVKKFSSFYWKLQFITTFTRPRYLSLSRARSIQSMLPPYFSKINFNIILPYTLRSFKWDPSLRFPHQNPVWISPLTYTCYKPCPPFPMLIYQRITSIPRLLWMFCNIIMILQWGDVTASLSATSWRTTPCRLFASNSSIYSQLPTYLEAIPPFSNWARAMPWWQGHPCCSSLISTTPKKHNGYFLEMNYVP